MDNKYKDEMWYFDNHYNNSHMLVQLFTEENGQGEAKIEIARGFIKDDLIFKIQNEWQAVDSWANSMVKGATGILEDWQNTTMAGNKIGSSFMNSMGVKSKEFTALTNSKIINYTDYAKRFNGTTVSLPESIEFYLINDDHTDKIKEQLNALLAISSGSFLGALDALKNSGITVLKTAAEYIKNASQQEEGTNDNRMDSSKSKGDFAGIIYAPNGYEYDPLVLNRDTHMKGTVKMRFADKYDIDNLLIDDIEIEVSKQILRKEFGHRPLYVKVTISFVPATLILKEQLQTILNLK